MFQTPSGAAAWLLTGMKSTAKPRQLKTTSGYARTTAMGCTRVVILDTTMKRFFEIVDNE